MCRFCFGQVLFLDIVNDDIEGMRRRRSAVGSILTFMVWCFWPKISKQPIQIPQVLGLVFGFVVVHPMSTSFKYPFLFSCKRMKKQQKTLRFSLRSSQDDTTKLSDICNASYRVRFNLRVWSWLRTNAGGRPNTCKSNGCSNTLVAHGRVTRGNLPFGSE